MSVSFVILCTHTHTGFHVLWRHSINVMVFILYKLYFLSPYPKPFPQTKLSAILDLFLHFEKSLFPHGDQKNIPTRSKFTGTTILEGPDNIENTKCTHTHFFPSCQ